MIAYCQFSFYLRTNFTIIVTNMMGTITNMVGTITNVVGTVTLNVTLMLLIFIFLL